MATIIPRARKNGSIAFLAQIFARKDDGVYRESKTFDSRELAELWASQREVVVSGKSDVPAIVSALGFNIPCDISYPAVPAPTIAPSHNGDGIPELSGVYFLWNAGVVEYVGKSKNLRERARIGHQSVKSHHQISFVLVDEAILGYAECFYIGVLRPTLNFVVSRSRLSARRA